MRGFIKAPEGYRIISADYAQIEARVLLWLARDGDKLQAFRDKMDPYCLFASVMYGVPYADFFEYVDGKRQVKEKYKFMRQICKSAVLGCGFGLGGKKFQEYCDNSDIIITQEQSKETVEAWRGNNEKTVKLWSRVEQAAIHSVLNEGERVCIGGTGVVYYVERYDEVRYWLRCQLPSGRCISYYRPKVESRIVWNRAKDVLSFRTEWVGKSFRETTYGGKLVENMVQAIARDVMVQGGLVAEQHGYKAIMLVHDEIVTLVPRGFGSANDLCRHLCTQKEWVTDLPIEAEGAEMERYGK
jgi:DNA polymerase